MNLARMTDVAGEALAVVWRCSWQAAVLVLVVLAVQRLLGGRVAARWRYNLWALVLVRLAVPVLPSSPVSVFNLVPQTTGPDAVVVYVRPVASEGTRVAPKDGGVVATAPGVDWAAVLVGVWAAGVIVFAGRVAWESVRLWWRVRESASVEDEGVTGLLARCAAEMGVRRAPGLVVADWVEAPALVGWWRPRVLVPGRVLREFSAEEVRLIFLHELGHVRRRDVLANWVGAGLLAVHWFNPLMWVAAGRVRADREMACDELVLSVAGGGGGRRAYGETMLKLLAALSGRRSAAAAGGAVGILEDRNKLTRRIVMIARFGPRAKGWSVAAAVAMVGVSAVALTDAVRAQERKDATPATQPAARARAQAAEAASARAGEAMVAAVNRERPAGDAERDELLNKVVPEARFDAVALPDVIEFLRETTGANIVVNWKALEAAGIERNVQVSVKVKDVRLGKLLELILSDIGGGTIAMGYAYDQRVLALSTAEDLDRQTRRVVYDVEDLIVGAIERAGTTRPAETVRADMSASVVSMIKDHVAPDSWRDNGGNVGSVTAFGGKLIVTTTNANHLEIAKLLADLREGNGARVPGVTYEW